MQSFSLPFGTAHVLYPEASEERCTAALLLEVDPVGLVRGAAGGGVSRSPSTSTTGRTWRPRCCRGARDGFKTAMEGRKAAGARATAIPLEARLPAVPARGGEELVRRLFEPLGYEVDGRRDAARRAFPDGATPLTSRCGDDAPAAELLTHLYVLLPVLDDEKHYWVDDGRDREADAPRRGLAARAPRAGADRAPLPQARAAAVHTRRWPRSDEAAPVEDADAAEEELEQPVSLRDQRLGTVQAVLQGLGRARVLDLGCGAGTLLERLLRDGYDRRRRRRRLAARARASPSGG